MRQNVTSIFISKAKKARVFIIENILIGAKMSYFGSSFGITYYFGYVYIAKHIWVHLQTNFTRT